MTFLTLMQIEQLKQDIHKIIEEIGIEEFQKRMELALRATSKTYTITCMLKEAARCENTNK